MNDDVAASLLINATANLNNISDDDLDEIVNNDELMKKIFNRWAHPNKLYIPNDSLKNIIDEYTSWCENDTDKDSDYKGKLMEEIAILAFSCLKGFNNIKSYQSFASQIDLSITGDEGYWIGLMQLLGIEWNKRIIVIEAKNESERVDTEQFSKFCFMIQNIFDGTSSLGVFFTRYGATGFPDIDGRRRRGLSDAQALQILFHAKTGKYIIVLDHNDIIQLKNIGALPIILRQKILAVENWNGLYKTYPSIKGIEVDLPPHLAQHITP